VIFISPEEFAQKIKGWIEDKSGLDIEVIDVTELTSIANFFVIASGSSERQVKAISENIEYEAEKLEIFPKGIEGQREARWILMDYFDVIVHIFHAEERDFYSLEKLWKDSNVFR
jgi:ribosome-associated protein